MSRSTGGTRWATISARWDRFRSTSATSGISNVMHARTLRQPAALLATAIALAGSACAVHQTDVPGISGPSELSLSLTVTATPDSISQDGASQSAISVLARDANGKPMSGLPIRLDMQVGGALQDFGALTARNIVTSADGRATSVYIAPP